MRSLFRLLVKFFLMFIFFNIICFKVYGNQNLIEPVLMFFSNSPEYVKGNGYLISGTISQFTPTIIYFYHLNDSTENKKIYVKFSANCQAYVDFVFSNSKSNYFKVGNDVGRKFFKDFSPEIFTINGEYIFQINFDIQELVSGYFWIFSNGRIDFEAWVGDLDYRYILPTDNKHVKGIFGIGRIVTFLPEDMDYLVVGDIPLEGIQANMLLKGTYKIFYHFVVNRQIRTINFSARGGPSIPMYILKTKQGDFIYTSGGIYKPYDENKIFSKEVFFKEFFSQPLGASYYPVYYKITP